MAVLFFCYCKCCFVFVTKVQMNSCAETFSLSLFLVMFGYEAIYRAYNVDQSVQVFIFGIKMNFTKIPSSNFKYSSFY